MDKIENKKNFTMKDLCSFKLDFGKENSKNEFEKEKEKNENIKQINNSILNNSIYKNVNKSRFIVTLKDVSKANKDAIQKMGAKGILEVDNQLKIILGSDAGKIIKCINDLK